MVKRLAACTSTAVAAAALTLALAGPANATVHYYSQDVKGNTHQQCQARGKALAQEKMDEGYVVTWLGCHGRKGTVYWSDEH